jgi:ketosteroid isomerase-like protein
MDSEKLDLVRQTFEAYNAGEEVLPPIWAQDAEVRTAPGFPEGGPFRGRDEIRRFFEGLREGWQPGTAVTIEKVEEVDDKVVVSFNWRGVGETSGIETSSHWLAVYTFRGDEILRVEYFTERDAALEAAAQG